MDPAWLPWCPEPSKPRFRLPDGAVDAHCHVFGPARQFPFADERRYTPCDAPADELRGLRDFLGFERNVIVQATCHGHDNRALCDAVKRSGGKARGVASVPVDVGEAELQRLDRSGIRGARINFVKRLVEWRPESDYERIGARLARLGWHIVVYFEAEDLPRLYDFLCGLPAAIVIDHMGLPDVTRSPDDAPFRLLLKLLREKRDAWCKVTCPERMSRSGPPDYADVVPFARRVVEEFPDRVLWGTDWPHPNMRSHMPDDGKLVDFIPSIALTPDLQQRLLVDNPMRLYWPEEAG